METQEELILMVSTVKLSRLRALDYIVNYSDATSSRTYHWAGAKGNTHVTKDVPYEVYEYLMLSTTCFRDGELVVAKDEPNKKELEEHMPEVEEYKNNAKSREEIIKLLKGNVNALKKELSKVTSISEKRFIKSIADELSSSGDGLASTKVAFIDEWIKPSKSTDE